MNPYRYGDNQFVGPPSPADIARLKKKQGQQFFVGPPAPEQPGVDQQMQAYSAQQPGEATPAQPPSPMQPFSPYRSMLTDPSGMNDMYGKLSQGMNFTQPGAHADLERKAQENKKFGVVRNFLRTPEELALMDSQARGEKVRQALDERGEPKFKFNAQTEQMDPVYESTGELDQENPVVQQKQGLSQMESMARDILGSRKPQLDLSPLAAFTDAQTGSHFAQSYKAPNNEHMVDDAVTLAEKIQERRKDIASAINAEKQRMTGGGSYTDMVNMMIADKLGMGNKTPDPKGGATDQSRWNQWYGKLQGDKSLNAANESNGYLTKALSLIKTNNPVAFFNSKMEVIRAMGNGARITNYELANEPGAQDFVSKFNQALETMQTGEWTKENQKKYVSMLTDLAQEQQRLVKSIHSYHRQSGVEGYGLDPGKVDRQLDARQKTPVFDIKPGEAKGDEKSAELKKLMEENKKIEDILNKHGGK